MQDGLAALVQPAMTREGLVGQGADCHLLGVQTGWQATTGTKQPHSLLVVSELPLLVSQASVSLAWAAVWMGRPDGWGADGKTEGENGKGVAVPEGNEGDELKRGSGAGSACDDEGGPGGAGGRLPPPRRANRMAGSNRLKGAWASGKGGGRAGWQTGNKLTPLTACIDGPATSPW